MRSFAIVIMMFFAAVSFGQPPKKANTILIKGVSQDSVIKVLAMNRYEVKVPAPGVVNTEFRNLPKSPSVRVKLLIIIENGNGTLSGQVSDVALTYALNLKNADELATPIENRGMKGSSLREAWNEMIRIAHKIGKDQEFSISK